MGDALVGVEYELLPGDTVPTDKAFDVVSLAVVLRFSSGVQTVFTWQLQEGAGSLIVSLATHENPLAWTEDVSARWGALLGQSLADQVVVMHETDQGRRPWAVRLIWSGGDSLVIALGELGAKKQLAYIPDNLIVTSYEDIATGYHPWVADYSAWGTP
jgi:hypothetical protein